MELKPYGRCTGEDGYEQDKRIGKYVARGINAPTITAKPPE